MKNKDTTKRRLRQQEKLTGVIIGVIHSFKGSADTFAQRTAIAMTQYKQPKAHIDWLVMVLEAMLIEALATVEQIRHWLKKAKRIQKYYDTG